jgi:hypothetical protein
MMNINIDLKQPKSIIHALLIIHLFGVSLYEANVIQHPISNFCLTAADDVVIVSTNHMFKALFFERSLSFPIEIGKGLKISKPEISKNQLSIWRPLSRLDTPSHYA